MLEGPGLTALLDRSFDGYQTTRQIGSGRAGALFEAVETATGRTVALRFFHPYITTDPGFGERFEREASALLKLRHPNLVPVLGYGAEGDLAYVALEHIQGESLRDRLARAHGQSLAEALALAVLLAPQIGNAVSAVHRRGFVHGDIKPSNILLATDGRVYLANTGIASIIVGERTPGMAIGTPEYMAPEQEPTDGDPSVSADLYACGVVLYEMLVGRVPFEGPTPASIMRQHVSEAPPAPRRFMPRFPAPLERALLRALAKDPADRYPDMRGLLAALVVALDATVIDLPQLDAMPVPEPKPVVIAPPIESARPEPVTRPEPLSSSAPELAPPVVAPPPEPTPAAPAMAAEPAAPPPAMSEPAPPPVFTPAPTVRRYSAPPSSPEPMAPMQPAASAAPQPPVTPAQPADVPPAQAAPTSPPIQPAPSGPTVRRISVSPSSEASTGVTAAPPSAPVWNTSASPTSMPPAQTPAPPPPEPAGPTVRRISLAKNAAAEKAAAQAARPAVRSTGNYDGGGPGVVTIISGILALILVLIAAGVMYFVFFRPGGTVSNPTKGKSGLDAVVAYTDRAPAGAAIIVIVPPAARSQAR